MARVKEQMVLDADNEFGLELSYQEWLRDNYSEPSEEELKLMARAILAPYTNNNLFLYVYSVNNIEYVASDGA